MLHSNFFGIYQAVTLGKQIRARTPSIPVMVNNNNDEYSASLWWVVVNSDSLRVTEVWQKKPNGFLLTLLFSGGGGVYPGFGLSSRLTQNKRDPITALIGWRVIRKLRRRAHYPAEALNSQEEADSEARRRRRRRGRGGMMNLEEG